MSTSITAVLKHNQGQSKDWQNMFAGTTKTSKKERLQLVKHDSVTDMVRRFLNGESDSGDNLSREHAKTFHQIRMAIKGKVTNLIALDAELSSDSLGVHGRADCIADYNGVLSIITFLTEVPGELLTYHEHASACAIMFFEKYDTPIVQSVVICANTKQLFPVVDIADPNEYLSTISQKLKYFNEN